MINIIHLYADQNQSFHRMSWMLTVAQVKNIITLGKASRPYGKVLRDHLKVLKRCVESMDRIHRTTDNFKALQACFEATRSILLDVG